MLVSQLGLKPDALQGETVVVTGAGGEIGYEAARALLWLGANVVIAEINQPNGCKAVLVTLKEQSEDWMNRSLFERQGVIRDFKKTAGMPVEERLLKLERLNEGLRSEGAIMPLPLDKLAGYYEHLADLAMGYEKDKAKRDENLRQVYGWRDEVEALANELIIGCKT